MNAVTMAKPLSNFGSFAPWAAGIFLAVGVDRRIRFASPSLLALTGFTLEELVDRDCTELFATREAVEALFDDFQPSGSPRVLEYGVRNPLIKKGNSHHPLVWMVFELGAASGEPLYGFAGTDCTDNEPYEVLEAERFRTTQQVLAGLAHTSRNALQRCQACLDLLLFTVQDRPKAVELIERIQRAQDDLLELYEETRSFAAPIRLHRTQQDVKTLLVAAWDRIGPTSKKTGSQLVIEPAECSSEVSVDGLLIELVFRNILENACASSSEPVRVEVAMEMIPGCESCLRISIRDNGPGLSSEARRGIFEPFFTTKARCTGLGMATARRIVHAHGGWMAIPTRTDKVDDDFGSQALDAAKRERANPGRCAEQAMSASGGLLRDTSGTEIIVALPGGERWNADH